MADYSNFKENELLKVESKFIHKGINHVEIYENIKSLNDKVGQLITLIKDSRV